jgi:hypothetical protein
MTAEQWNFALGVLSLLLAIYSIVLTFRSIKSGLSLEKLVSSTSKQQLENAVEIAAASRQALDSLRQIEERASTHQVGPFPEHLTAICDLIKNARSEILIACQAIGYGASSAPTAYAHYEYILRSKALDGVKVQIIVPTDEVMSVARTLQFKYSPGSADPKLVKEAHAPVGDLSGSKDPNPSLASISDDDRQSYMVLSHQAEVKKSLSSCLCSSGSLIAREQYLRSRVVKEMLYLMLYQQWTRR